MCATLNASTLPPLQKLTHPEYPADEESLIKPPDSSKPFAASFYGSRERKREKKKEKKCYFMPEKYCK